MDKSGKIYKTYVQTLKEELIPAMGCTEPIAIAYAAAKAREVLPEELRKAGAVVDVLPAYVTVPADHNREAVLRCLEEGHLDCVTFGSSSTVENFLALIPAATLKAHPEVQLAAIGPVTARTLAAHGLACRIQPEEYTIPALVAALQTHFARSARA